MREKDFVAAVLHGLRFALTVTIVTVCVASWGCSERTTPAPAPQAVALDESSGVPPAAEEADGTVQWDALYMEGSKIGYGWTRFSKMGDGADATERSQQIQEMTIKRGNDMSTMRIELTSMENSHGTLVAFQSLAELGPTPMDARGEVRNGKLYVTTNEANRRLERTIDVPKDLGGYAAVEQSLRRKPMVEKEHRELAMLAPVINVPSTVTLDARGKEEVKLLDRTEALLRIDTISSVQGQKIATTYWTDDKGEVLKVFTPAMNMESYRTTREVAIAKGDGPQVDLLTRSIVKTERRIENPLASKKAVYRLKLKNGNPAEVFAQGLSQQVKPVDERTAELTVQAIRPHEPKDAVPAGLPPGEDARNANSLISSDDPAVVQMSKALPLDEQDPWNVAVSAEAYVHEQIQEKNFSQALASAADVAKSLEGDCTEHAVLLAAILRARGIPARMATGLVYVQREQGFGYHMWTEAWINDRWVPLDATLGQGGIGAAHIKLADSTLSDDSALGVSLQVAQVIGQLSIEVLSVE